MVGLFGILKKHDVSAAFTDPNCIIYMHKQMRRRLICILCPKSSSSLCGLNLIKLLPTYLGDISITLTYLYAKISA